MDRQAGALAMQQTGGKKIGRNLQWGIVLSRGAVGNCRFVCMSHRNRNVLMLVETKLLPFYSFY
jgi:hypothetical protein